MISRHPFSEHVHVSSLSLPPTLCGKLIKSGYTDARELVKIRPTIISKDCSMSVDDAVEVIRASKLSLSINTDNDNFGRIISAREKYEKKRLQRPIVTFCQQLDTILGGGLQCEELTEICGVPGIGKTQFVIQLAVNVQIPEVFGGVAGEAVYIDTEGSFMIERLEEMATGLISHLQRVAAKKSNSSDIASAAEFTLESILSRIHYTRIHDYTELIAVIRHRLPTLLEARKGSIKLIIIDSIAAPFRHDFEDMALRYRILAGISGALSNFATRYGLAVLLTNQVTTKFSLQKEASLVPALGDSWAHNCTNRIVCYWKDGIRNSYLFKSPSYPPASCAYRITSAGVRGLQQSSN